MSRYAAVEDIKEYLQDCGLDKTTLKHAMGMIDQALDEAESESYWEGYALGEDGG